MITTESSNANALRMAKLIIQNKLAACVSISNFFQLISGMMILKKLKNLKSQLKVNLNLKII